MKFYLKLITANFLHWINTVMRIKKFKVINRDGIKRVDTVPHELILRLKNSISKIDRKEIKVWESEDKADCRIFGVETIVPEVYEVASFLNMEELGKEFYGTSDLAWFCMHGQIKSSEDSQGSGGGWHRDSIFRRQLKIIVYLSNADKNNGCFQYILQSNRTKNILDVKRILGHESHRYTPSEIEEACRVGELKIINCIGAAGDSILVDTRGIHRGMPLVIGEREAITFYMYPRVIPNHMVDELQ